MEGIIIKLYFVLFCLGISTAFNYQYLLQVGKKNIKKTSLFFNEVIIPKDNTDKSQKDRSMEGATTKSNEVREGTAMSMRVENENSEHLGTEWRGSYMHFQ